jgi:hypothetical protein
MATHNLKTWPEAFQAVWDGFKTCEVRKNDRDFRVSDSLWLNEWSPDTGTYTGRALVAVVTHVVPGGRWGLPDDLCVMSVRIVGRGDILGPPTPTRAEEGEK